MVGKGLGKAFPALDCLKESGDEGLGPGVLCRIGDHDEGALEGDPGAQEVGELTGEGEEGLMGESGPAGQEIGEDPFDGPELLDRDGLEPL